MKDGIFNFGRVPMTFALQKEVCQRLIAGPNSPDYSRPSIMAKYLCDVKLLFTISGKPFI